ncbi:MAG: hypothetical protein HY673_14220 [Chloroflexi bacterium]|nr:hypothetical protein [Chloroflexota bacterium]
MAVIDGTLKKLWLRGRRDPVFWSREIVGDTPYDKQEEVLYSVRDNLFTTVAAAHGVGKTYIASRAAGWFLTSHEESIVVTTAPTGRQVRELLWGEINRMNVKSKYPLGPKTLTVSWPIAPGWYAIGFSTDDPNKFQGFHAPSGSILVIADEAAGIPDLIYNEGIDNLLTSDKARLLMIGNPTEPTGRFFDSHEGAIRSLHHRIRISAFDTPNLKAGRVLFPYLVTPQWVKHRAIIWGEESSAYLSRVLALFPSAGTNTLIPAAWVDWSFEADEMQITKALAEAKVATIGVDPARFGDDSSAVGVRRGKVVTRLEEFYHLDTIKVAKEVKRIADEEAIGTPSGTGSVESFIVVDTVGVGAGVADWLRDAGYNVIDFQGGNRAFLDSRFENRRAEAWFGVRERFRKKDIFIPRWGDDGVGFHREEILDKLRGQFSGIQYKFDLHSRYVLERKEDMKRRLAGSSADKGEARGRSPDAAEAIIHAFAFDSSAETIVIEDDESEAAKTELAKTKPDTVARIFADLELERKLEEEFGWLKGDVGSV